MLSLQCLHLLVHATRPEVTVIVPFAKTSNGNPQVLQFVDEHLWNLARAVKQQTKILQTFCGLGLRQTFEISGVVCWDCWISPWMIIPPTASEGEELPGFSSEDWVHGRHLSTWKMVCS